MAPPSTSPVASNQHLPHRTAAPVRPSVRAATRKTPIPKPWSSPPSPPALGSSQASSPRPPECLPEKRPRERGKQLRRAPATASAPSRTKSCVAFSPSSPRGRPCRPACSPSAGDNYGSPPLACASLARTGRRPCPSGMSGSLWIAFCSSVEAQVSRHLSSAAGDDIDVRHVRLWVRYAVKCKVHVLRLGFFGDTHAQLRPNDPPIASRHLTNLVVCGLVFSDGFLDFSTCPELQDLKIIDCSFEHAERISSQSLRHLSITAGRFNQSSRARILAPNLSSLVLEVTVGRTPILQKMPLLVMGIAAIRRLCKDYCSHSNYGNCGDMSCGGCIREDSASVILHVHFQKGFEALPYF